MRQRALERLEVEGELRRALERGELTLHYQPLCGLADGRVAGVEALVRWDHPQRGLLAPAEFLGIAEETGLIHPLGDWVLREAAHEIERWRAVWPGAEQLLLTINLSSRELSQPDLGEKVAGVLSESGVAPSRLALEITESGLLDDGAAATDTLRRLKALGVALILDDFGTGWSSLTHLKRLPIDALKVDRSFVAGVGGGDNGDETIVAAILGMASGLGMAVIPEGIEHEAQRDRLAELGCQLGQGFYFAAPMTGAQALAFVRERAAA
jgi:Amt family ammonium transporter